MKTDLSDLAFAMDGCNGLRTRSLKPRRAAVSNRPTVTPLSRGTCSIRHHPPANSELPFNGLAPSELRRIFCSDDSLARRHETRETTPGLSSIPPGSVARANAENRLHQQHLRDEDLSDPAFAMSPTTISGIVAGTVGRVQRFKDAIA